MHGVADRIERDAFGKVNKIGSYMNNKPSKEDAGTCKWLPLREKCH